MTVTLLQNALKDTVSLPELNKRDYSHLALLMTSISTNLARGINPVRLPNKPCISLASDRCPGGASSLETHCVDWPGKLRQTLQLNYHSVLSTQSCVSQHRRLGKNVGIIQRNLCFLIRSHFFFSLWMLQGSSISYLLPGCSLLGTPAPPAQLWLVMDAALSPAMRWRNEHGMMLQPMISLRNKMDSRNLTDRLQTGMLTETTTALKAHLKNQNASSDSPAFLLVWPVSEYLLNSFSSHSPTEQISISKLKKFIIWGFFN